MSEIVEVRVIDASLLPRLAPVPLQVHEPQFAAVRPAKETSCGQHRPHRVEVTLYGVDCRFGKVDDPAAAHLRFDNKRPAGANLDDLALNGERSCVEVD